MSTVYLKDGTKANLITKTDNGFVVDPYVIYHDYDSKEEYEETSGAVKLVDKVFETAPKAVVEEEYKQILLKIEEQEKVLQEKVSEFNRAKFELSQLQRTKTDVSKLIFNRQELKGAKRLIVWIKDAIAPRIMDVKNNLKLTISYTITQFGGEEKCWAYQTWSDSVEEWSRYSEYIDPEYGIKADLTDEEILAITYERQTKHEFDSHAIGRTDAQWLTPGNIERQKVINEQDEQRQLKMAEEELIKIQNKINRLKGRELQSVG